MNVRRWFGALTVVAAAGYVAVLGWAMVHTKYDLWGALVLAPLIIVVTLPVLRRIFADDPWLFAFASAGLLAKFAGCAFRYWVAFDAYGGTADAGRYHVFGKFFAGQIRSGAMSPWEAIPADVGTPFIERFTTLVYTLFGSSRLGGFLLFGWLGYWGAVFFLRAAIVTVPGLSAHRYALLLFFAPTMVYWPSSIGKEAWMCGALGIAAYGIAHLLAGRFRFRYLLVAALGITGAGFVRPHLAAIWVGAAVVALVVQAIIGGASRRPGGRLVSILVAVLAVGCLALIGSVTLKYLDPSGDTDATTSVSTQISDIFDETERRSEQGGSSFDTITLSGPQTYPYAIFRTLTRPLLFEARSFAEMLPAAEMTALFALGLANWRRFANLRRVVARSPYLVFAVVVLLMFGIAFTSIGNLGILTRQRSLVMPLFLLLWCLPPRRRATLPARPDNERIRSDRRIELVSR